MKLTPGLVSLISGGPNPWGQGAMEVATEFSVTIPSSENLKSWFKSWTQLTLAWILKEKVRHFGQKVKKQTRPIWDSLQEKVEKVRSNEKQDSNRKKNSQECKLRQLNQLRPRLLLELDLNLNLFELYDLNLSSEPAS